ncbi:RraA family protein [Rhodococcus koreensis]|uniref:RraA family protein n=1 Tax=Rhodococcus koreensis TaxID=99653 RepID=UPI00197D1C34|nr:RraA family protein [Rhodococcus koreensis]QSE84833.1 RraA family protein [Rhodococcus koreensis]
MPTPTDLGSRLAALPTAALSDALDKLGLPGSLHGIGPLAQASRSCGPAFTVAYAPIGEHGGSVGDFLDDVPAGAVVVIDNDGRTDCTVWGGIMTGVASARGIGGTVIHGVCRDTASVYATDYPMWCAGKFMRTGKDRVRLVAIQQPLTIDGVTIRPGDLVCGDEDGVVIVPIEHAEEVATIAEHIESTEARIVHAVRDGASLVAARTRFGYHALQTTGTEKGQ